MSDRRELDKELKRVNELYQEKDLEMRKAGASIEQRQKMRDMLNNKKSNLTSELGDDLSKLNTGKSITVKNAASNIPFSSLSKKLGKKALSVLPFAGAAYGLASGDPAMAAEEAAGDIPVIGQAYEALKPESAGQSVEDEKMMLAEDAARKSYANSPAAEAKKEALRKLKGY
jgi:hypothetical protein